MSAPGSGLVDGEPGGARSNSARLRPVHIMVNYTRQPRVECLHDLDGSTQFFAAQTTVGADLVSPVTFGGNEASRWFSHYAPRSRILRACSASISSFTTRGILILADHPNKSLAF